MLPLLEGMLRPSLTREQQVLALRNASIHPKLHLYFSSAGLLVDNVLLYYYVLKNIKTCLHHATQTTHKFGRPTDDMRSLVQTIIHATLPSPSASTKKFSSRQVAGLLGLPLITYLRGIKAVKGKRAAQEGIHTA